MIIAENLNVVPQGCIESGKVNIQVDESTGLITFSGSIIVGWAFLSQTLNQSSQAKIDPSNLLSASFHPGLKWQICGVTAMVQSIKGSVASVQVAYVNGADSMVGYAYVDLSGQYIVLTSVLASGTVQGMSVTLELQRGG
jgi:hypothetical protein